MVTTSGSFIEVKGKVVNHYIAYREEGNVILYVEDLDAGTFTENRADAQVFEGAGWSDRVAGVGAVLQQIIV